MNWEQVIQKALGTPTPKQDEFLTSTTRYVGYGGAKGGGKSHSIRLKATILAFAFPGIRMLIIRRTYSELRENHVIRLQAAYATFPKEMRPTYNNDDKAFIFPWGSYLKLGYCATDADVTQYQGQEYDVLFVDEATQITDYQWYWLDGVVRGANDFPKRTYITCNPGGVGHSRVQKEFIKKELTKDQRKSDYTFIHAKIWDNQPLFDKDKGYKEAIEAIKKMPLELVEKYVECHRNNTYYTESIIEAIKGDIENALKLIKLEKVSKDKVKEITPEINRLAMEESIEVRKLKNLPEQLRKAWLEGDWNVFAGQYFTEWDEQTHIIEPRDIPWNWRRSLSLDYGLDMLAVLWFAVSPEGQVICYRSYEQPDLTVSMAAEKVLRLSQTERIEKFIAPPDLWNRHSDTGISTAELFRKHGVPLIKSGNDRIDGWLNVKEYFKVVNGKSKMVFFNTCEPIIRCIPELQYDPKKINDVATEPHNVTHSPDALRYWCSQRQLSGNEIVEEQPDPFHLKRKKSKNVPLEYMIGGFKN